MNGYDPERDDCAHGYPNGHGCDDCDRYSRRMEVAINVFWVTVLTLVFLWLGRMRGWW